MEEKKGMMKWKEACGSSLVGTDMERKNGGGGGEGEETLDSNNK